MQIKYQDVGTDVQLLEKVFTEKTKQNKTLKLKKML